MRARDFDPASQTPVLVSALVREPGNDEELATRQSALQAEATALLDELDQSKVFSDIGSMAVTGSSSLTSCAGAILM